MAITLDGEYYEGRPQITAGSQERERNKLNFGSTDLPTLEEIGEHVGQTVEYEPEPASPAAATALLSLALSLPPKPQTNSRLLEQPPAIHRER